MGASVARVVPNSRVTQNREDIGRPAQVLQLAWAAHGPALPGFSKLALPEHLLNAAAIPLDPHRLPGECIAERQPFDCREVFTRMRPDGLPDPVELAFRIPLR